MNKFIEDINKNGNFNIGSVTDDVIKDFDITDTNFSSFIS